MTHGVTFLPECDQIIVIKDSRVSESGTYQDLLGRQGDFADFLIEYMTEASEDEVGEEVKEALEKDGKLQRRKSGGSRTALE